MVIAIAAVAAQVPQAGVRTAQVPTAQVPTATAPQATVPQPTVQQPMVPTLQAPQTGAPLFQPFSGTWSASGERQSLRTENGQAATTVQLSGAVTITTGAGLSRGFRGEVIGFDDAAGFVAGRVVWTDDKNDHIFSVVTGDRLAETGRGIRGTITGGTGRYAGMTGDYQFHWQYLVTADGSLISGRAVDLRGQARPAGNAR
jgi:hypothetical protein